MAHGVRTFGMGDFHLSLCDQGPRQGGSQKINPFIYGIGPQGGKDKVTGEFLCKIVNVDLGGPGVDGLFPESVQFLLLSYIGGETDYFTYICFQKPAHYNRCVQTARIGKNNLFHLFFIHDFFSSFMSVSKIAFWTWRRFSA